LSNVEVSWHHNASTHKQKIEAQRYQPPSPVPTQDPTHEKTPNAVAFGKLGGKKGGDARAKKLTPERRKEIAEKAARVRWNRH